jgi:hypothetical protein
VSASSERPYSAPDIQGSPVLFFIATPPCATRS